MDDGNQLGVFLGARREQVRPEDVGVPDHGRRRVPGLRREELAMLAGVSADYYVRLEQGRDRHPSAQVLDALARALRLEDDAAEHLHELAAPGPRRRRRPAERRERLGPGVTRLVSMWDRTPALVLGRRMDVLAANPLATILCDAFSVGTNIVRETFLDPALRTTYPEWRKVASEAVAALRAVAGLDLDDPRLTELVGELSLKSPEFRRLWARHEVRMKSTGSKRFRHPLVGELTLHFESFVVAGASGQMLVAYHAEPGSSSERALTLLAGLAADAASTPGEQAVVQP